MTSLKLYFLLCITVESKEERLLHTTNSEHGDTGVRIVVKREKDIVIDAGEGGSEVCDNRQVLECDPLKSRSKITNETESGSPYFYNFRRFIQTSQQKYSAPPTKEVLGSFCIYSVFMIFRTFPSTIVLLSFELVPPTIFL